MSGQRITINGKIYNIDPGLPPGMSLLAFIRDKALLPGTKYMCREGGCGACIVARKKLDPSTGDESVKAVNSCLLPVMSCIDEEIITIEGLGNRAQGYHPIQRTLAKFNGTQCGACTPGMIMNMYSLLKDNPNVTMTEIEKSFGGNICRCTGYRPIMEAFKSLAADASDDLKARLMDIEDLGEPCNGPQNCSKKSSCVKSCSKKIVTDSGVWHRPSSISEIFNIIDNISQTEYKLLGGNTGHGVYRTITPYPNQYIDINRVAELRVCRDTGSHLELGAATTLSETIQIFEDWGEGQYSYLKILRKHFELIGNVPVRNTGTLGGNLFLKYKHPEFPSDIFITLAAVGAKVVLENKQEEFSLSMTELLRFNLNGGDVIKKILLPKLDDQYKLRTFKIMPRAQNVHAYVNAGFLFKMDDSNEGSILERPTIVFGGISGSFVHAEKCEDHFERSPYLNDETIRQGFEILRDELAQKCRIEHRIKLATSLLYKFILGIAPDRVNPRFTSGSFDLERTLGRSQQDYGYVNSNWPKNAAGPKVEGVIQCSGEAEYVPDIPPFNGQLYGALVLAREANAKLVGIDATEALKEPGVVAFFSAKDIPGENVFLVKDTPALIEEDEEMFCTERVLYGGQPVGIVVAETQDLASRVATSMIKIKTVSPEAPPVLTARQALNQNETHRITEASRKTVPDVKIDSSQVKHTIEGEFELGGQYHFTIEPQCCVCVPTDVGLEVFSSSQFLYAIQVAISKCMNIPSNAINLKVKRLGGAFGVKISRASLVATACALAAIKLNRPVKMVLDIETMMEAIGKRHSNFYKYKVLTDESGKIVHMDLNVFQDIGVNTNDPSHFLINPGIDNTYDTATWEYTINCVKTDTPSACYMRGPGSLEGVSIIETIMDHIAVEIGQDPLDVRLVNIDSQDTLNTNTISSLVMSSDYRRRRQEAQEYNLKNRWRKKAVSLQVTKFPIDYYFYYHASVSIYGNDGSVSIIHGGVEMGQGVNTKVAQACAAALGTSLDFVSIKPTLSHCSPNNSMAGASVTSESCVYAALQCCKILQSRLEPVRNKLGERASWAELIHEAYKQGVDLNATFMFGPSNSDLKGYNTYGASVVEIELDVLTGKYQVIRADILEDAGKSLSPEIDMGQIEGAYVMGLGYFLYENIAYDKVTGMTLTNRTWNYWPPGALDIPTDFRVSINRNSDNVGGVLRSKSVGEPPICLSIGAMNAIREAIISARSDAGLTDLWVPINQPCSVEKVLTLSASTLDNFKLQ